MATAPKLAAPTLDPEIERSRVFDPSKHVTKSDVSLSISPTQRNPKDAIRRFELEKAYGFGRRRKTRKLRRKTRKTRKYRK